MKNIPVPPMKLLGDAMYCIKVDYFMYDSENDKEYTQPCYLTIDTETKDKNGEPVNLITFSDKITANLRVFNTEIEAGMYRIARLENPCYCENVREVKIAYNFETGRWEEM